jgi:hypothetical protein
LSFLANSGAENAPDHFDQPVMTARKHLARWFIEAIIGDAVPGLGVVAIDGDFASDPRLVVEAPFRLPQLRFDEPDPRDCFIEIHDSSM